VSDPRDLSLACPVPNPLPPLITLAHGGGGSAMHDLIDRVFAAAFRNDILDQRHDAATLEVDGARLAFTTDSFVVQPLEFPGGDIGSLAVYGTVNDLAMAGARPLYLSAGFILEEGLPVERLETFVRSMQRAAEAAGVQIVTGDTKVIGRRGDGLFINTAGIGVIDHDRRIGPGQVRSGDRILVNGDLGRHGIAVMAVREGLEFETVVESDCAPLAAPVLALLDAGVEVHCLRDLTRGGLASALNEIATASGVGAHIVESAVPVRDDVRGACELLGLDPLYVANEGRFVACVAPHDAARALQILGADAAIIGEITGAPPRVILQNRLGANRILDMLPGDQLPRIC